MDAETLTVSQLNERVRRVLQKGLPGELWVTGEVFKYDQDLPRGRTRSYGQVYFEILEKDQAGGQVKAGVKAVLWGKEREAIESKLAAIDSRLALRDGLQVRLFCRVDFYVGSGAFQLKVVDIDPAFTLGQLALDRTLLLKKLAAEGLLQRNRKLPLAPTPLRVGLVTSVGSAAFHDFTSEIESSKYRFSIIEVDTQMQGTGTPKGVCQALASLVNRGGIDVIVIARGGGGKADLVWFDHEAIARAIATCPLPVLTGIGHEVDRSVADDVAFANLKTPTAAAQFLVKRLAECEELAEGLFRDIAASCRERLKSELAAIGGSRSRLVALASDDLRSIRTGLRTGATVLRDRTRGASNAERQRLAWWATAINRESKVRLSSEDKHLRSRALEVGSAAGDRLASEMKEFARESRDLAMLAVRKCKVESASLAPAAPVLERQMQTISLARSGLTEAFGAVGASLARIFRAHRIEVASQEKVAALLDPANVLRRGYSILVRSDGTVLTKVASAKPGETIKAVLQDGALRADVREVEKGGVDESEAGGPAPELRRRPAGA